MYIRKTISLAVVASMSALGIANAGSAKSSVTDERIQPQTAIELQSYGPDGSCICSSEKSDECQQISSRMHCCAIWNQYSGCRVFCATACQIY